MLKNGFYTADKTYNKLMHMNYDTGKIEGVANFAIIGGTRTAGKTVGWAIKMIELLEKGENFMILSRYKNDIDAGYLQAWWEGKIFTVNDADGIIQNFLNNNEITFDKKTMKVNGEVRCYAEAISMSAKVKNYGGPYNNCRNIIIDEAAQAGEADLIIEGRPALSRIVEIRDTVARGYENAKLLCNVIFIMNISEEENWLYKSFELKINKKTKFTVQKGVIIEVTNNINQKEEYDATPFGQVVKNLTVLNSYYKAGYENEYQDNRAFIKKQPLNFNSLRMQILINGSYIGLFRGVEGLHCAIITRDDRSEIITSDNNYYDESVTFSDGIWDVVLRDYYKAGKLTFQDLKTKNLMLTFLRIS